MEKGFGIFNTSIIRTEEEAVAYYKKVIDVIKAERRLRYMKKTLETVRLETVRLELGDYFGNGSNFYDWEKEFGIFDTSITRTEEEAVAYYKKVIDVIKAVFETLSWSKRTDSIVRLMNNYVCYNGYETEKVKGFFRLYNQGIKDFETDLDDVFLDDLYNELLDTVIQDRYDLFEYQSKQVEDKSFVKDEEFNKILNSLPLDKILMNEIIKVLFE